MAKPKKNNKTAKIAAPVREYLRQAVRQKIRTNEDRNELAAYLGQAPTSVSNLLKGEGGLDTWVAAIGYCYDIKPEMILEMMENYHALMKKHQPKESDKIAAKIDLPESKRAMLFSALYTALKIDKESN